MTCIRAIYDEIGTSKLIKKLGEIWMLISIMCWII